MKKIGIYLRELRENKGLKQKEIAALTGKSGAYLNKVEKGDTTPAPAFLEKMATALDQDFIDLYLRSLEEKDLPESLMDALRHYGVIRPLLMPGMPLAKFHNLTRDLDKETIDKILLILETICLMIRQNLEPENSQPQTEDLS